MYYYYVYKYDLTVIYVEYIIFKLCSQSDLWSVLSLQQHYINEKTLIKRQITKKQLFIIEKWNSEKFYHRYNIIKHINTFNITNFLFKYQNI